MKSFLIALVIFQVACSAFAQNEISGSANPLLANGYVGISTSLMNFGAKNFEAPHFFQGAEGNFSNMTFSFLRGSLLKKGADSTYARPNGVIFKVGYRLGRDFILGSNSFTSVGFKPYVQISGSYASMPNKLLNNGKAGSGGLVVSPGVQFKFSHLYVNAAYDAGLYMGTVFWGGNGAHNLGKGFLGGLTVTIGLDNAFDLLAPEAFTMKGYNVRKSSSTSESGVKFDNRGAYKEIVTTTVTSYSPGERALVLMAPFWGAGPMYSFHPQTNNQAATSMVGASAGFRIWYLMVDGFYETGQMGLKDPVPLNDITITFPQLRDYSFSSTVAAEQYGGRIGINATKILALMNFSGDKMSAKWRVPFVRIQAYYNYGVAKFSGTPEFTLKGARQRLAEFQTRNGITPGPTNNPDFLPGSTTLSGWGANLEIGAVYFSATKYEYANAEIANHIQYAVGANIPFGRLFRSFKVRAGKFSKKDNG
jgi:hypothetical protein